MHEFHNLTINNCRQRWVCRLPIEDKMILALSYDPYSKRKKNSPVRFATNEHIGCFPISAQPVLEVYIPKILVLCLYS